MGSLSKGCRLSESENDFEGFELVCRYTCDSATGKDKIDRGHQPAGSFRDELLEGTQPESGGNRDFGCWFRARRAELASPLIEAGRRATMLLAKLRDAQTAGFLRVDSLLPLKSGILADGRAHDKGLQEDGIENHPHPLTSV